MSGTEPTTTPTLTERLTGSTGTAPLNDGGARGAVAAVFTGAAGLISLNVGASPEEIVLISSIAAGLSYLAAAAFDKWLR